MSRKPEVVRKELEDLQEKLCVLRLELEEVEKRSKAIDKLTTIVESWNYFEGDNQKWVDASFPCVKRDVHGLFDKHSRRYTSIVHIRIECDDGKVFTYANNSRQIIEDMHEEELSLCLSMLTQKCPDCWVEGHPLYKRNNFAVVCKDCYARISQVVQTNEEVVQVNGSDCRYLDDFFEKGPFVFLKKVREYMFSVELNTKK